MDKTTVLARLAQDRPLFHYLEEASAQQVAAALTGVTAGECSWAVGPPILQWIGEHLSGDMVTMETGAGYTTVVFAVLAKHHYCCTFMQREADKIRAYLEQLGVPDDRVTFCIGSTEQTLPRLEIEAPIDFAYIDGCHGYPFPALDWHYIDKFLRVGGIIGLDNAELRPVREHCEFLEENGTYRLAEAVTHGCFVRFYTKLADQNREWVFQPYSRAKRDPCDSRLRTRLRRQASRWLKPYLY